MEPISVTKGLHTGGWHLVTHVWLCVRYLERLVKDWACGHTLTNSLLDHFKSSDFKSVNYEPCCPPPVAAWLGSGWHEAKPAPEPAAPVTAGCPPADSVGRTHPPIHEGKWMKTWDLGWENLWHHIRRHSRANDVTWSQGEWWWHDWDLVSP